MLYLCGVKPEHVTFDFKQFSVTDRGCGMKLGTDGVLLGAWTRMPGESTVRVCDAGAGCGIVALMLAQRHAALDITAVDIDAPSARDAAANFACSPWSGRLRAVCADITAGGCGEPFDMIVSNPPFFHTGERAPGASRAAARHADSLSADWLIEHAPGMLASGGSLTMIVPAADEERLVECAAFARMYPRRLCRVSSVEGKAPIRLLIELRPADGPVEISEMALRRADGPNSQAYVTLFKDFYLHL